MTETINRPIVPKIAVQCTKLDLVKICGFCSAYVWHTDRYCPQCGARFEGQNARNPTTEGVKR